MLAITLHFALQFGYVEGQRLLDWWSNSRPSLVLSALGFAAHHRQRERRQHDVKVRAEVDREHCGQGHAEGGGKVRQPVAGAL
eukprot:8379739-Pyramimonas_sp.AAC.1